MLRTDQMSTVIEKIVDRGMGAQKSLRLTY